MLKCDKRLWTISVHFFGVFGIFVGGNAGEAHVLLLHGVPVTHLSLDMEANHQLVDHRTNDGAYEWGKSGHQEPAISFPKTLGRKWFNKCNL